MMITNVPPRLTKLDPIQIAQGWISPAHTPGDYLRHIVLTARGILAVAGESLLLQKIGSVDQLKFRTLLCYATRILLQACYSVDYTAREQPWN